MCFDHQMYDSILLTVSTIAELLILSDFPKTIDFPSGIQVASASYVVRACSSVSGLPPDEESMQIFEALSNRTSMNTICEPSGDHRGSYARTGGKVSCIFSLPSTRLRHRVMSG